MTAVLSGIGYPLLLFSGRLTRQQALAVALAFVVLFPLWFFRYARSLWLAWDYFLDRPRRDDGPPEERGRSAGP